MQGVNTIELQALNTIEGVVLDSEEDHLEDIEVRAIPVVPLSGSDKLVLDLPRITITDEYGSFSLMGLPGGDYKLYASHKDSSDSLVFSMPPLVTTFAGDNDVTIVIEENGFISGTVSCDDGGLPIPCDFGSFKVGLSADSLAAFPILSGSGEFLFPNLPPGKHDLFVEINGQSFYEIEVLADEETELDDITLTTTSSSVTGQVIDENEDPVPYARIIASNRFTGNGNSVELGWPTQTMITDEYGEFDMEYLDVAEILQGGYYLIAEKPGIGRSQPILITGKNMGTIEIESTGALEGTITCNFQPIPALIKIESLPDRALSLYANTYVDGYYRLDRLAPGDYRVSVIANESVCDMQVGVEIGSDEVTITSDYVENVSLDIYNEPPFSDAGESQIVYDTDPVTLDGSASSDPDNDIVSYEWFYMDASTGERVFVDDEDITVISAPFLNTMETYVLVVTDSHGAQSESVTLVAHLDD